MFSSSVMSSFLLPREGQSWQYWSLTITLLGLTWCATLLSVFLCMQLRRQKNLINQQQCEIDRLQTVEQTAVISQARKLMHRLASDIHDGPLQELKLIMDRLELLQMESPQLPIDPILDHLSTLGTHLRQHLSQTRAIALTITPELRDGLAQGIQTRLTQLTQSGELTLRVIQHLHPLEEPTLNSLWLEAREDIYRFFNEAIHNVILHAQPPHGTASQITVTLEQQNTHCTLTLENDGAPIDPAVFEPTPQQRQRGGYGTKLMDTIAAELPEGSLQRIPLEPGGLCVRLTWNQGSMLK
jgi:signal transduction histidine kinase